MPDFDPVVFMIDQFMRFVGLAVLDSLIRGTIYAVLGGFTFYFVERALERR